MFYLSSINYYFCVVVNHLDRYFEITQGGEFICDIGEDGFKDIWPIIDRKKQEKRIKTIEDFLKELE